MKRIIVAGILVYLGLTFYQKVKTYWDNHKSSIKTVTETTGKIIKYGKEEISEEINK